EDRIDADLAAGAAAVLVTELQRLTDEHPLRERFAAQLMIALYRAGRQTAALEEYRRLRSHLAEELGLEPGPPLKVLERRILEHDPSLNAPRPRSGSVKLAGGRRRAALLAILAAVTVVAAALWAVL